MQEIKSTAKRMPMFYLLISAISGIFLGKYCISYLEAGFIIAVLFIFLIYFSVRKFRIALILALLLIISSIFAFYYSYRDTSERNHQNIFPDDKQILILARGYLLNEPQPRSSGDASLIIPSVFQQQESEFQTYRYSKPVSVFNFQVLQYSDGKKILEVKEKIKIFADSIFPELPVGELIEIPLKIYTPYAPSNPSEFDFRSYERQTGIIRHGIYQCNQGFETLEMPFLLKISPSVISAKIRSELSKKAMKLPPKLSAIFLTLTIGESESLRSQIKEEFKHTGTLHLLVISGLHIGLLILIFEFVLRLLRVSLRKKAILIIIVLIFFWILVGHRVSLSRAIVFALIFYFGVLLHKPVNFPNLLSSAAFFVLIINPHELFHLGLYLSFSAVLFISYTGFKIAMKRREIPELRFHLNFTQKIAHKTRIYFKNAFLISVAGLISTIALIWHSFGLITPGAILMNILAIPLMVCIMAFSMIALLFESIFTIISIALSFFNLEFLLLSALSSITELFIFLSSLTIDILLEIERAIVRIPGCYFYLPPVSATGMILLIIFFICLLFRRRIRISKKILLIGCSVIISFIVHDMIWLEPENNDELIVTQFSFGENSDIIVETPEKECFIFTTCKKDSNNAISTMVRYLQKKRFKKISAIFITDSKATTLNGLIKLMNNFSVERIIITQDFARSFLGEILINQLENTHIKILYASAGIAVNKDMHKKVYFDFWAPQNIAKASKDLKIENPQEAIIAITGEFGNIILMRETDEFTLDAQLEYIKKNNIDVKNIPLVITSKISPKNKYFHTWLEIMNPRSIFYNPKYKTQDNEVFNLNNSQFRFHHTSKSGALTYTYNFTTKSENITTFK